MSSTDNGKRSRCSRAAKPDYGVFDPDKFWGHILFGLTLPAGPENFEARVEQAWAYMKGAYFAAEEHERLRMVLARLITADTL
jgi:hypothetical protein